tara:strand:+ start:2477 stop:2824 length:348 start_codon:yes stop_codon:yes gene_type:complete
MSKFKPVMPSLREKKRYLSFEVVSKNKNSFKSVEKAISNAVLGFLGVYGSGKAGINIMDDQFNFKEQKGIIRVNNKNVDALKASLVMVKEVDGGEAIVRSIGVSGILNKARRGVL